MASREEAAALASAIQVFSHQGYLGATVAAIAAGAGVSSAYLHRSFGGKKQLFHEALTRAVFNVLYPQRCLAEIMAALHSQNLDDTPRNWFLNSLVQDSGALVMQGLTSGNTEWRRITLAALKRAFQSQSATVRPSAAMENAGPVVRLRVLEFTHFSPVTSRPQSPVRKCRTNNRRGVTQ